jgi:hypothetical protein
MHAVSADKVPHWIAMGFDELVMTADIEALRATFGSLVGAGRHGGSV